MGDTSQKHKTYLRITIDDIDETQAQELVKVLWLMQHLGQIGASRWLAFYADGDGAFKPRISVYDAPVESFLDESTRKAWEEWHQGTTKAFMFDPD